jgi:hypothetical protein
VTSELHKKAEELSNVLGLYKAEWLDSKLFELFSEPAYFNELKTPRPCVLVGGRGTGKTTVLRGLSYEGQLAFGTQSRVGIEDWPYFGLYYRVNTNRVTAFRGPEVSDDVWVRYFGHYINQCFCMLMLDFVVWFERQTSKKVVLPKQSLQAVSASLALGNVPKSLEDLAALLRLSVLQFEASINTIADLKPSSVTLLQSPIDALATALVSTDALKGKKFFFLIDEFENFEDYQQRVLNTLIKHSSGAYTFKIGVRELGWRQRATLNANEQLTSPADYAKLELSDLLKEGRFRDFAEKVVTSRIADVYQRGSETKSPTPESLLPGLSEIDEAEVLLGNARCDELTRLAARELGETVETVRSTIRPAVIYFLHGWADGHKGGDFVEDLRAWKDGNGQLSTRLQNYFHSSLFAIRKGRRGVQKHYAGWDTFVSLANGNIRYLLELVHTAVAMHLEEFEELSPIGFEVQTKAATAVGKKNLSELEGLSVHGGNLTRLLLSLGRVFQVFAAEPWGHAPEVNQFKVNPTEAQHSGESEVRVKNILDQAVMHLALVRYHGSKLMHETDIREYDYMIHPIFAPFFVFSYRRKRKLSLDSTTLVELVDNPKEAIRHILHEHNRVEDIDLPDQLKLFDSYYASN